MTYLKELRLAATVVTVALGLGACATGPDTKPPRADTGETSVELPATDAGLPGVGPIRRYDWFKGLWRERRTAFAEQAPREQGALVFLGDSITQGWGDDLGRAFGETRVANRGISGDTTRGVLIRLREDVLSLNPAGIVILVGTNDLEENATPEMAAQNLRLILQAIQWHNFRTPVVLCEVFPSSEKMKRPAAKITRLNELYQQLARDFPQVTLVKTWEVFADSVGDAKPDEFPDLLHPNEKGYAKWAEALRPVLNQKQLLR